MSVMVRILVGLCLWICAAALQARNLYIYSNPGLEKNGGEMAPASAANLKGLFDVAGGWTTRLVSSADLADPAIFNAALCDLLILPYGPNFPYGAVDNIKQYVRDNGPFISIGGYAFANLVEAPPASFEITENWMHIFADAQPLRGHGKLTVSGWMKTVAVEGNGIAFMNFYQYDASDKLLEFVDYAAVKGNTDWTSYSRTLTLNPATTRVRMSCGLYKAFGQAFFDGVKLVGEDGAVLFEDPLDVNTITPGKWNTLDQPTSWTASSGSVCNVYEDNPPGGAGLCLRVVRRPNAVKPISTQEGQAGDGTTLEPSQFAIFDTDYPIRGGHSLASAADQNIFTSGPLTLGGPIGGWGACGYVGANRARWVPLLKTLDRYGQDAGSAGALIHVMPDATAEPSGWLMLTNVFADYAGASFAYFGVTTQDLFAPGNVALREGLVRLADRLNQGVFIGKLLPTGFCYRAGDMAQINCTLANNGKAAAGGTVVFEVFDDPAPTALPVYTATRSYNLGAQSASPEFHIPYRAITASDKKDVYIIRATLKNAAGAVIDQLRTGFTVWNPATVAAGPDFAYRDNYYHFGGKPRFSIGTDMSGDPMMGLTPEHYLHWREDATRRNDLGLATFEVLQGGESWASDPWAAQFNPRAVDAIVQLCQSRRQVYMPMLYVGEIALSDAALDARAEGFLKNYVTRYKDVPGLIYYLEGDLLVLDKPLESAAQASVNAFFNQYLTAKYKTDAALRTAWGSEAPAAALGSVAFEQPYFPLKRGWKSNKAFDYIRFRHELIRRWGARLTQTIRQIDTRHPIVIEYYDWPYEGVDIPWTVGSFDFANNGFFFKPTSDLAPTHVYCDGRSRGKSFGLGEYGGKTPWLYWGKHQGCSRRDLKSLYLTALHATLAMGGSHAQNWQWNDACDLPFQYGLNTNSDYIPKPTSDLVRNTGLFFKQFALAYTPPEIGFLTADNFRASSSSPNSVQDAQCHDAVIEGMKIAVAAHVGEMLTLNEVDLRIPPKMKVIFYPLPFLPDDATLAKLKNFVADGGTLYMSGDLSYDVHHQRTRTDRLSELCGVAFASEVYPGISWSGKETYRERGDSANIRTGAPAIRVTTTTAQLRWANAAGQPVVVENTIGKGRVIFSTDPLELHGLDTRANNAQFYQWILGRAGVQPLDVTPNDPQLQTFRLPLADGTVLYVLMNFNRAAAAGHYVLAAMGHQYGLEIDYGLPALLWLDAQGEVLGCEVQGRLTRDGQLLIEDSTSGALFAADHLPLTLSRELVFLPGGPGRMRLTQAAVTQAVAALGTVRDAQWKTFETLTPERAEGGLSVNVDDLQCRQIGLLTAGDNVGELGEDVARMMTHPEWEFVPSAPTPGPTATPTSAVIASPWPQY